MLFGVLGYVSDYDSNALEDMMKVAHSTAGDIPGFPANVTPKWFSDACEGVVDQVKNFSAADVRRIYKCGDGKFLWGAVASKTADMWSPLFYSLVYRFSSPTAQVNKSAAVVFRTFKQLSHIVLCGLFRPKGRCFLPGEENNGQSLHQEGGQSSAEGMSEWHKAGQGRPDLCHSLYKPRLLQYVVKFPNAYKRCSSAHIPRKYKICRNPYNYIHANPTGFPGVLPENRLCYRCTGKNS